MSVTRRLPFSHQTQIAYEQLLGDLETLHGLVVTHQKPVRESDIRAAVNILRRWLCESELTRLANELGVKTSFEVERNADHVAAVQADASITYYLTGGVRFDGVPISRVYDSTKPAGPAPLVPMCPPTFERVRFKEFVDQKRIYFEGEWITCREIVTFTANKLGGVHLDFRRNDRQLLLARASAHLTFGGPPQTARSGTPGEVHLVVEQNGVEVLSGFHVEVIAAATTLMQVHFDGEPLMPLRAHRSLSSRLKELLGLQRKPKARMYEFKDGAPPSEVYSPQARAYIPDR